MTSMRTVHQASRAFLTTVGDPKVKTFFAVCCEMVLHPRMRVPSFLWDFHIALISAQSKPWWE